MASQSLALVNPAPFGPPTDVAASPNLVGAGSPKDGS